MDLINIGTGFINASALQNATIIALWDVTSTCTIKILIGDTIYKYYVDMNPLLVLSEKLLGFMVIRDSENAPKVLVNQYKLYKIISINEYNERCVFEVITSKTDLKIVIESNIKLKDVVEQLTTLMSLKVFMDGTEVLHDTRDIVKSFIV